MVLYDVCVQACAVNYGGESMEVEERDNCVFMLACGLVVACEVFKNLFGACVFLASLPVIVFLLNMWICECECCLVGIEFMLTGYACECPRLFAEWGVY